MTPPKYTFFVTASDWLDARESLFTEDGCENAGVFLCGAAESDSVTRLLAREFIPVPRDHYTDRKTYHLEVSPRFYNDVITMCERTGLHPVIIHSHPMQSRAGYSQSDDYGESRLLSVLESLLPDRIVASLVVGWDSATGRRLVNKRFASLAGMRSVGASTDTVGFAEADSSQGLIDPKYDRQVRAFGIARQRMLSGMKIGIVGLGGTGSIIAEQAARLGIGRMVLIDNDAVDESNLTRLVGAARHDLDTPKVVVMRKHLNRISRAVIEEINDSALKQSVLKKLSDCDAVFGCVDNDRTRAALNRFAYQYLIPVIDMGVRIDARSGKDSAAAGRVSLVGPGMTCLRCSHHLSSERILAESLSTSDRELLSKEGYVLGIEEAAPAVISLNMVVAGLAMTAFLNVFVQLTGGKQPTNQIYDASSGSVFPVSQMHEVGCDVCDPLKGVKALGDSQVVSAY